MKWDWIELTKEGKKEIIVLGAQIAAIVILVLLLAILAWLGAW